MIGDGEELINWLTAKIDRERAEANGHAKVTTGISRSSPPLAKPDEEVLEKCRGAKNAAKFSDLFDRGDTSGHGGDDSAADLALLNMLAFWTQDHAQLERIFSASALGRREKWRKRGDYRTRTIERALADLGEIYEWPMELGEVGSAGLGETREPSPATPKSPPPSPSTLRGSGDGGDGGGLPEVIWFAELGEPKPRRFLVADVVPERYPTTIYGEGGVAKSMLSQLLAIVVASKHAGGRWLGLPVNDHGVAVYLDFELDPDEQHRRVRDLCNGLRIPMPKNLAYISGRGRRTRDAFAQALKTSRDREAKIVVVDSFGLAMDGDMGSSTDVLGFVRTYIDPLCGVTTPFIVDHISKVQAGEDYQNKTAFGSVYKHNTVRSALQIQGARRDRDAGTLDVRVRHHKNNFGFQRDPFDARLTFSEDMVEVEALELDDTELVTEKTLNADDRVLLALEAGPAYPDEIAQITSLAHGTVVNCLTRLRRAAKVVDTGEVLGKARQVGLPSPPSPFSLRGDGDGGDGDDGGSPAALPYKGGAASDTSSEPSEADPSEATVEEFLANPPWWLDGTLRCYRREPERFLRPLCVAVAEEVLKDGRRWEEVADEVRRLAW